MSSFIRILPVSLILMASASFAQSNSDQIKSNREFLRPVDAQKRNDLMSRRALEIRSEEFFAKPGKFEIYEFDIDVLETKGKIITITPFGGPPIEILSNGIKREPDTGWFLGTWSGELNVPNSSEAHPIEWFISTWSLDSNGELQAPDPNRESTLSQLGNDTGVILEESYSRLNEKLVHSILGKIVLPPYKTYIKIVQPTNDLEYLMMYEVDEDRWIPPGDGNVAGPDDSTEIGRIRSHRLAAYRAHVENVRRELGLTLIPE